MMRTLLASAPARSTTGLRLRQWAALAGLRVADLHGYLHVFDEPCGPIPQRTPGQRYRPTIAPVGDVGIQKAACESYTLAACEKRQVEHGAGFYGQCPLSDYVRAIATGAERPRYNPADP